MQSYKISRIACAEDTTLKIMWHHLRLIFLFQCVSECFRHQKMKSCSLFITSQFNLKCREFRVTSGSIQILPTKLCGTIQSSKKFILMFSIELHLSLFQKSNHALLPLAYNVTSNVGCYCIASDKIQKLIIYSAQSSM